jgi:hypothetical protein
MQWKQLANPDNRQYDVVICSVPWTDTDLPLMAPAILKKSVEQAGMTCLAVDLNIEIFEYTITHPQLNEFIKFFFEEKLDPQINDDVFNLLKSSVEQILSFNPKWIGLSLISYVCQVSTKWMCYMIRKLAPNIKIVIGGPGCLPTLTGNSEFVNFLLDTNLIDYHIRGDGEVSFYQLLTGNTTYPGINDVTWQELTKTELMNLPTPDFDDYDLNFYKSVAIPIIGSRGCVRQCTFCDYITNWKKFQWRTAENIFAEIVYQSEKYRISNIKFQDSLINGNQKEFYRLIELLAEHNEANPHKKIYWSSYYIFREHTSNSSREWELLSKSGAVNLAVGIENFNQHIRYHIGKKFSDEAIIYHLEQALKHKIKISLLHITGYINETQKDIDYVKQWLRDNLRFKDILLIHWGTGLGIFDNTYLGNNKEALGITMIGKNPHEWISKHTDSTPEIRARWSAELIMLSKELGYTITDNVHDMHYLLEKSFM